MSKLSYDPDKPLYEFMHDIKDHILSVNKIKYGLILNFINEFTNLKLKSLKFFKNIDLDKINMEKFEEVLSDYKYKLEGELEIEIDDIHINFIKILSDCLNSINYSIHSYQIKNEKVNKVKTFLTILDEPKKIASTEFAPSYKEIKGISKEYHKIKKDNKKLVLKFINEITKQKLRSLKKFNFELKEIDKENFDTVLSKYKDQFEKEFEIKINHKYTIIEILEACAKSIGHILKKDTKDSTVFVSFMENMDNKIKVGG